MLGWLFKSKKNDISEKQNVIVSEKHITTLNTNNKSFDVKVVYRSSKTEEKISELLREATAKKDSGNIDEAVNCLKKAYKKISKTKIDYTIATFLRLPLYLQKGKKAEEAWKEFNNLLKKGYPNQSSFSKNIDKSKIYDKMRLFMQRGKKPIEAVQYGIMSIFFDLLSCYKAMKQEKNEKFKNNLQERYNIITSKESYRDEVKKLLKKAKKQNLLNEICSIVESNIKQIPNINIENIGKTIDDILTASDNKK